MQTERLTDGLLHQQTKRDDPIIRLMALELAERRAADAAGGVGQAEEDLLFVEIPRLTGLPGKLQDAAEYCQGEAQRIANEGEMRYSSGDPYNDPEADDVQIKEWEAAAALICNLRAAIGTPPAESAPTEADQRAAFEAWVIRQDYEIRRVKLTPNEYWDTAVQLAWEAWQAALAASRPEDAGGKT